MNQREAEVLMARTQRLVFGSYGYTDDVDGRRVVRFGGSGLFVAPHFAITAAHVIRDHFHVEQHYRVEDLDRMRAAARGHFTPSHSVALFQPHEPPAGGAARRAATWLIRRTWQSPLTDIALMFAIHDDGPTTAQQLALPVRHLEWSLLPPPIGSEVVMLGFPETLASADRHRTNFQASYTLQTGRVAHVFDVRRDAGLYSFPCFEIDQEVAGGFSGGPVIYDGRLSGIVSGTSFGSTYAATLWPVCLIECAYPDLNGRFGRTHTVGTLLDERVIISAEWEAIRPRIAIRDDERGRPIAYLIDS